MIPPRLFDTHCHLFEHGFHGRAGVLLRGRGEELATYERYRTEFGIERSLVVGYEEAHRYRGNTEYLDRVRQTRPWLVPLGFAAVGAPLPARAAVSAYVTTADDARWFIDAIDHHAPAVVSLNVRPEALAVLSGAIRRHPSTWFLISHLGLPGPTASREQAEVALASLQTLAGLDHVSVKLSGQYAASVTGFPHRDVQHLVDLVADRFGIPALTWGSDFSPCLEYVTAQEAVACVLPTGISDSERDAIYFGNADRQFAHYFGVTA